MHDSTQNAITGELLDIVFWFFPKLFGREE